MYGNVVPRFLSRKDRSVVGSLGNAPYGNVILRVGHETEDGWEQTEHVVLTPEEAFAFARDVRAHAMGGAEMAARHGRNVEEANRMARRDEGLREAGLL